MIFPNITAPDVADSGSHRDLLMVLHGTLKLPI